MLGRVGSATVALGLIAVLPNALAQEATKPPLENQPVPEARQQTGTRQGQTSAGQQEADADRLVAAINAIGATISDLIAEEDAAQRERQEQREIADLQAQKDMAFWAKAMSWAAFGTVLLTALGVFLIWRTLIYTRRAADSAAGGTRAAIDAANEAQRTADAAIESNRIQRETFVELQRARLVLKKITVVGPLQWKNPNGRIKLCFEFENIGPTPALGVWVDAELHPVAFDNRREETYVRLAAKARAKRLDIGWTVGRNERWSLGYGLSINEQAISSYYTELSAQIKRNHIDGWTEKIPMSPTLIGCAAYGTAVDNKRYTEGFIASVYGVDENNDVLPIGPAFGDIPAKNLRVIMDPAGKLL